MGCAVASMLLPTPVEAQNEPSPADRAAAEALFREGRELIKANRVEAACRKFEESYRLEPAPGTMLNMAHCHMLEGRVATAWTEFHRVATDARRSGHRDRERIAMESIAKLEQRLPKIVIRVEQQPDRDRIRIRRNATLLRQAAWGTETPIDPGPVLIEVSGDGFVMWTKSYEAVEGELLTVTVPVLDRRPSTEVLSVPAPRPRPVVPEPPARRVDGGSSSQRTAGIVLGAAGLVSVGTGAYFGVRALQEQGDAEDACPVVNGVERCTDEGVRSNDEAWRAARIANVGIGVGLVAVAAGTYLYLDGQSSEAPEVQVSVATMHDGAGAWVRGVW